MCCFKFALFGFSMACFSVEMFAFWTTLQENIINTRYHRQWHASCMPHGVTLTVLTHNTLHSLSKEVKRDGLENTQAESAAVRHEVTSF